MESYCFRCRSKQGMTNPRHITLKNGKPVVQDTCPVCGTRMFRTGKSKRKAIHGSEIA